LALLPRIAVALAAVLLCAVLTWYGARYAGYELVLLAIITITAALVGVPLGPVAALAAGVLDYEIRTEQHLAAAVVNGVRLTDEEWQRTRCMIVDASFRVIASSRKTGVLDEHFNLVTDGRRTGFYRAADGHATVSFAATPGYESYRGLGWYGVVVQTPPA